MTTALAWIVAEGESADREYRDLPYGLVSNVWPGLARLLSQCGGALQPLTGIIGCVDARDAEQMAGELDAKLGQLRAMLEFFIAHNGLSVEAIASRRQIKFELFTKWHDEARPVGADVH